MDAAHPANEFAIAREPHLVLLEVRGLGRCIGHGLVLVSQRFIRLRFHRRLGCRSLTIEQIRGDVRSCQIEHYREVSSRDRQRLDVDFFFHFLEQRHFAENGLLAGNSISRFLDFKSVSHIATRARAHQRVHTDEDVGDLESAIVPQLGRGDDRSTLQ